MGRGSALGHEASEIGVKDSHIFYRRDDSDVSVWSDNDDRTSVTVDPKRRISLPTSVERDTDVVDENPKPHNRSVMPPTSVIENETNFVQCGLKKAGTSR